MLVHLGAEALNVFKDLPAKRIVPVSVPRAGWRPCHGVWATLPTAWYQMRHTPQQPLRLGGTHQSRRDARTLRAGGFGAQKQSRASRLHNTSADENKSTAHY